MHGLNSALFTFKATVQNHLDKVFPCDMFLPKALSCIELELTDDPLQALQHDSGRSRHASHQ